MHCLLDASQALRHAISFVHGGKLTTFDCCHIFCRQEYCECHVDILSERWAGHTASLCHQFPRNLSVRCTNTACCFDKDELPDVLVVVTRGWPCSRNPLPRNNATPLRPNINYHLLARKSKLQQIISKPPRHRTIRDHCRRPLACAVTIPKPFLFRVIGA